MQKVKYLDFPKEYTLRGAKYRTAIDRVFKSGVYILGPEVISFENQFAKFLGVKYCIGVANGLEAIQISLMALGIGKGDEVITTPISAVATTLAILAVGATPVFADVDEMGQLEISKIDRLITKKTKAILPVYLYGHPLDLDKLRNLCKKHKLFLVEDACQAHGSKYKNKNLGNFGDVACYSFYPTKNLGAIGDGGAIVTNDPKLAKICAEIRDYGQENKYIHSRLGLNSRLDEIQAAILSEKLKFLNEDNKVRRQIAGRYIAKLEKIHGLKIVMQKNVDDSNFHIFAIRTNKRDELKKYLSENGITTLIHYPLTIPDQPVFNKKYKKLKIPEARKFVNEVLSLPCHPYMNIGDVDYISEKILEFFPL